MTFQNSADVDRKSNANVDITPKNTDDPPVRDPSLITDDAFPAEPTAAYNGYETEPFRCTDFRTVAIDINANLGGGSRLDIQVLKRNSPGDDDWRIMNTVRAPNASGQSNVPPHTLRYRDQDYGSQPIIKTELNIGVADWHEIKVRARIQGADGASRLTLKALGGKGF